jgi:hypothetical protein
MQVVWPNWNNTISLSQLLGKADKGLAYLQGDTAQEIQFDLSRQDIPLVRGIQVFIEREIEYLVLPRPLLPHENLEQVVNADLASIEVAPYSELPFTCSK